MNASPQQWMEAAMELRDMKAKRSFVDEFMQYFVRSLANDPDLSKKIMTNGGTTITNSECHEAVVNYFLSHCFHSSKDSYALSKVHMLVNLCENGIDAQRIINHMELTCPHFNAYGIL
ncbi:hypothetical protein AB6A40_010302 [Gnathostoma spinigerum]|uniref:Legumain prodomain domain-containing protein n=1 Tax=Gnathostoma spinigerum TaxID=75299 RepID=A0ABD6F1H3_9BILA